MSEAKENCSSQFGLGLRQASLPRLRKIPAAESVAGASEAETS